MGTPAGSSPRHAHSVLCGIMYNQVHFCSSLGPPGPQRGHALSLLLSSCSVVDDASCQPCKPCPDPGGKPEMYGLKERGPRVGAGCPRARGGMERAADSRDGSSPNGSPQTPGPVRGPLLGPAAQGCIQPKLYKPPDAPYCIFKCKAFMYTYIPWKIKL